MRRAMLLIPNAIRVMASTPGMTTRLAARSAFLYSKTNNRRKSVTVACGFSGRFTIEVVHSRFPFAVGLLSDVRLHARQLRDFRSHAVSLHLVKCGRAEATMITPPSD
jgi:hypothetical protein